MFSRFMVIVNELEALEKTYTKVEKVMKILKSLPKKWETKVTTIQEAKDLTKLSLEELIGSLMTYEINLNNHQRVEENKKSIVFLASINDDEDEESESESDEDSMEEECTNEDANMCFMALEEHQDEAKSFSLANGLLFLVEVILFRSRSGRGPIEAQRSPAKHLMLTASQPVDP
ncbi:hypothetical protein AAG906_039805 [Vitis piasezkii]